MKWVIAAAAMLAAATGSARDLAVPMDKSWQHARTGVILRPVLDGFARKGISDATDGEFDVAAQYELPDESISATVYLYNPGIDSVAMWFDRSQAALQAREPFRHAAPATIDPVAFARSAGGVASALRQVYVVPGGAYRSTALAIVPVGRWLLAVRMSAHKATADQLDAQLLRFLAAIRWPVASASEVSAVPMAACATDIAFRSAKQAKPEMADMLVGLMIASRSQEGADKAEAEAPVVWCRDAASVDSYGIYRGGGATDSYVMAIEDAGRTIGVAPSLMAQAEGRTRYTVSLTDVSGSVSMIGSYDRMPAPKQVWAHLK